MAPDGALTRPTSDRVREAVFNALFSLDDAVEGAQVLDLFAGSGALGIEALSRGAAHATFVERARPALAAIEQNIGHTGLREQATIVRAEALDWLGRSPGQYDLVLCDPPYDFGEWPALLRALEPVLEPGFTEPEWTRRGTRPVREATQPAQCGAPPRNEVEGLADANAVTRSRGYLVIESDRELEVGAKWEEIRTRRYGGTVVTIVRRRQSA